MDTGEDAEIYYKPRGAFSTKKADLNYVSGVCKTREGVPKFKFEGCYLDKITVTNLVTG